MDLEPAEEGPVSRASSEAAKAEPPLTQNEMVAHVNTTDAVAADFGAAFLRRLSGTGLRFFAYIYNTLGRVFTRREDASLRCITQD